MQYYYNLLDGRVVWLYDALASCMSKNVLTHSKASSCLEKVLFMFDQLWGEFCEAYLPDVVHV